MSERRGSAELNRAYGTSAGDYSLSVVVPVYNEIDLVESALKSVSSFLEAHFSDYEIIIVESGSTDGSAEVCDHVAAELAGAEVLHEGRRAGFGSALRLGFSRARKDLVWPVLVDMPFPLDAVLEALPLLSQNDCVLSYRSGDNRALPKRLRSYVYNSLAKTILGLKVRHVNSAFRVYKRAMIQRLSLQCTDWTLDAEMLYEITRRGMRFAEIPIALRDRVQGKTSIESLDSIRMLWSLFKIRWQKRIPAGNES